MFFFVKFCKVHLYQVSEIKSQKEIAKYAVEKIKVFLTFLAFWWMTNPDPGGPKIYGSGSTTLGKTYRLKGTVSPQNVLEEAFRL
jgi:hypothetical protein